MIQPPIYNRKDTNKKGRAGGKHKNGKGRGSPSVIVMGYRKPGWADNLRRQKTTSQMLIACYAVVFRCGGRLQDKR